MPRSKPGASLDMTNGSPFGLLLRFSLPLIAGNALQQLYNMVDSMVVGRFVGHTALAAVGVSFPVIFMMSSLFMGFGTGAMVMVSQYFGGREHDNLRKTIDTVYTSLIVGVIPLTLVGVLLTNPILSLLSIPDDTRREAFIYLVIVMAGLIGSLGYNLNAGILQGIGDSKTPLLFLAVACALNIGLDLLLVLVIPMGVAGVALATIISQLFSWVFGIIYINKKYPDIAIRIFPFRFDRHLFWQIVRLGIPAGIQNALFSFATILMTRLVNSYGSIYAAGFSGANKLDTFAFLPIQSIAMAVTTYTGQNIGAGRIDRVRHGTRAALVMCVLFAVVGLAVIPAGPLLMRLFTDDPEVVDAGMAFLVRIMPFYTILGFNFTLNSVMRGSGEALIPMISSIVSLWLARLPAAYLLAGWLGRDEMHYSYVVGWAVGLLITGPYYLSGRWKTKGLTRAGANPQDAAPPEEAAT